MNIFLEFLFASIWGVTGWYLRCIWELRHRPKTQSSSPDEVLMQFGEQIDRAMALAEGKRVQLIKDGYNETIAEQLAATVLVQAMLRQ